VLVTELGMIKCQKEILDGPLEILNISSRSARFRRSSSVYINPNIQAYVRKATA